MFTLLSLPYLLWCCLAGQQGIKKLVHVLERTKTQLEYGSCDRKPVMIMKYICAGKQENE